MTRKAFTMVYRLLLLAVASMSATNAFVLPVTKPHASSRLLVPAAPTTTTSGTRSRTVASIPSKATTTRLHSMNLPTMPTITLPNLDLSGELGTYFLKQVISTGVPTVALCIAVAFLVRTFRGPKEEGMDGLGSGPNSNNAVADLYNDLYGTGGTNEPFWKVWGGGSRNNPQQQANNLKNLGIPAQQYIAITHLNSKLNSYQYSMTAATQSKALAAAQVRSENFDNALQLGIDSSSAPLPPHVKTVLLQCEKEVLQKGARLVSKITQLQTSLAKSAIDDEMKSLGMNDKNIADIIDPKPVEYINVTVEEAAATRKDGANSIVIGENSSAASNTKPREHFSKTQRKLSKAQRQLTNLELEFVKDVIVCLGPERANGIRTALLGDYSTRGAGGLLTQLQERPLSSILGHAENNQQQRKPSVFVTQFPGDPEASQVSSFREEVTAIVRNAQPGDEAVVVLQTGGGTVTGYGLAAAQLQRFKDSGMKLTICVEQVAASGGYMMCCVADKIIASPFAVLGSIGVISDIPNVYERLKEEGIEFQTVTAGKYKRTLTPTKKVTREDYKKTKDDIEVVFNLFREYVHQNRPSLNIEEVATGETWFGTDALDKGLCDEIKTVDDVLTEYVDSDYNVYDVKYDPPPELGQLSRLLPIPGVQENEGNLVGRAIRWLVRTVASEIKSELMDGASIDELAGNGGTGRSDIKRRYMMVDETADKIRAEG